MNAWILWFLIALIIVVVATRGRVGVQAMGHGRNRSGGRRSAPDRQPQAAENSTTDIRRDPNLEYQGEVYFFCSIEERDTFSANFQLGDYRPGEALKTPRASDRRI